MFLKWKIDFSFKKNLDELELGTLNSQTSDLPTTEQTKGLVRDKKQVFILSLKHSRGFVINQNLH